MLFRSASSIVCLAKSHLRSTTSHICLSQAYGCSDRYTHDSYVRLPFEPPINEEPQVAEVLHRSDHVMGGVLPIWEDQAHGSRKRVAFVRLLEEQQLRLIRLDRQTRPLQPFIADCVPRSEELGDICPLLCARKKDAVIHVHAQRGVIPTPHFVQQGRRVLRDQYFHFFS